MRPARYAPWGKNLVSPLAAVDGDGKDVLQTVIKKDGVYTLGRQYVLDILDLNLGDLSGSEKINLVLTAYTNWDNSEILSGVGPKPNGRFVQVKGQNGDWVTVFKDWEIITPSALPRTYVLDLTGKFVTNDYSIRIAFYPDVRFDYIGIDTTPEKETFTATILPVQADLHSRGYFGLIGFPGTPDYYGLSSSPPLGYSHPAGKFTRFGNVLPILISRDDKYVVLHHGDEISVSFECIPQHEGMARDFMLYSWGYYKGRDYPTGGTVEPLPFYGMSSYPYLPDETYPHDDDHIAYLNEYNTREYRQSGTTSEPNSHNTIYTDYVKVEVTQFGSPVGGTLAPVNKPAILAPFFVLAGVVVSVSAILSIIRKRRAK